MDASGLSSISTSPHQKPNFFEQLLRSLGWQLKLFSFSFVLLKCPSTFSVWTSPHLFYFIPFIFLFLLFNYSCVLLVYSYTNFLWKATSLSKTLFTVTVVSSLLTLSLKFHYVLQENLSVLSSFGFFFSSCKLTDQSRLQKSFVFIFVLISQTQPAQAFPLNEK